MHALKNSCVGSIVCDCFSLHGRTDRRPVLPEHMSYVKLLERIQDMLHSAMQGLESRVVDFVQALHLKLSAC